MQTPFRPRFRSNSSQTWNFAAQENSISPSGSALPASEDVLIRFCCHLANTLHHSSIKVYLSAIRSLHIEEGLPSPQVGCLRLQRVLWGIKRHQGSTPTHHNRADAHHLTVLELENVISALYVPLPSIYKSVAQLLAYFSFSLMAPLYIANS